MQVEHKQKQINLNKNIVFNPGEQAIKQSINLFRTAKEFPFHKRVKNEYNLYEKNRENFDIYR